MSEEAPAPTPFKYIDFESVKEDWEKFSEIYAAKHADTSALSKLKELIFDIPKEAADQPDDTRHEFINQRIENFITESGVTANQIHTIIVENAKRGTTKPLNKAITNNMMHLWLVLRGHLWAEIKEEEKLLKEEEKLLKEEEKLLKEEEKLLKEEEKLPKEKEKLSKEEEKLLKENWEKHLGLYKTAAGQIIGYAIHASLSSITHVQANNASREDPEVFKSKIEDAFLKTLFRFKYGVKGHEGKESGVNNYFTHNAKSAISAQKKSEGQRQLSSLDDPIGGNGTGKPRSGRDFVISREINPLSAAIAEEQKEALRAALDELVDQRANDIISLGARALKMQYGIGDQPTVTGIKDIAEQLGVKTNKVRAAIPVAERELKALLTRKGAGEEVQISRSAGRGL